VAVAIPIEVGVITMTVLIVEAVADEAIITIVVRVEMIRVWKHKATLFSYRIYPATSLKNSSMKFPNRLE
jgi:hypothetical protein